MSSFLGIVLSKFTGRRLTLIGTLVLEVAGLGWGANGIVIPLHHLRLFVWAMMVTDEFLMLWGVLFESKELQSDVGGEGVARAWSRGVCVSFSLLSVSLLARFRKEL